jgi:catalase-peroxidase
MMTTADMPLRMDPAYEKIARRFSPNPQEFADAFARAWYKLTHRDMGPLARYLGPLVPKEVLIWQDPVPAVDHPLIDAEDIAALKSQGAGLGLSISRLVTTAWASASTFRGSDKRGGANGARIRLAPQKDWEANQPAELAQAAGAGGDPERRSTRAQSGGKKISLADLIVLGGCAASRPRPKRPAMRSRCPSRRAARTPRRNRPMRIRSPCWNRPPTASATTSGKGLEGHSAELLVDRAQLLTLTAPEMTVLIGGLRALNANVGQSSHGVFTTRPGTLSNDFFVNLLDMNTKWQKSATSEGVLEGRDRAHGELKWTGTVVDLVFGSNAQLRAHRRSLCQPATRAGVRV